ncbi:MAG TPA: hypothetical protein VD971_01160 [Phycisphaerales bacterium]|nr:hypothetical protein [Phycisphaerales bacterium]
MGLDFAIDALYATDFRSAEAATCHVHRDGRLYPTQTAVGDCFASAGYSLTLRHVQLFDCYRAEWRDGNGQPCGAVVGQSADEAAVYALSLLRRQLRHAANESAATPTV